MFAYGRVTGLHMYAEQYHTSHFVYIISSSIYGEKGRDSMEAILLVL